MGLDIGPTRAGEVGEADKVLRLAFGTREGLANPLECFGDREPIRERHRSGTSLILVARQNDKVVGTACLTRWGSVAVLGRMAVHPDHWGKSVARPLAEAAVSYFDEWGVTIAGLDTFPDSVKHLGLYERVGFWPRYLSAIVGKALGRPAGGPAPSLLSVLPAAQQDACLSELAPICDSIYPGLDLTREARAVVDFGLGDTVLLREDRRVVGFAVCHVGVGTEAGSGACFVKFGGVARGVSSDVFRRLLGAVEEYSVRNGATQLSTGVNLGRVEAAKVLFSAGFSPHFYLVTMARPSLESYDHEAARVIDRWS